MLRTARFALFIGLSAAIPVVLALDPPPRQNKQETKDEKKKVEPPKKEDTAAKDGEEPIDRRNSRMKERARQIDQLLNDKKK